MEQKRTMFPRFYFVAQNDLLDLLSNGGNPAKIMKHMAKIFQAIDTLELEEYQTGKFDAKSMVSCVGIETVNFSKPLRLVGKVENYLEDVIATMRSTLKEIGRDSL
jgi:dynein heavy chain, axonemal